jgi:mono/diheme cytochrome c family protein
MFATELRKAAALPQIRPAAPLRPDAGVDTMPAIAHALALTVIVMTAAGARAQENLDRDKSGPKLFAATCVQCHKSARGLAKGRLSFTLSYYLRQHYTSSAASAQTLTAYLQSVDTPPAKAKRTAAKSQTSKAQAGKSQVNNSQDSTSPVSKAQPKNAAKNVQTRLPTGTISEDPRVKPPATIPGR